MLFYSAIHSFILLGACYELTLMQQLPNPLDITHLLQNLHASGKADNKLVRSGSQQTTEVPKEKSWVSSDCKPTLPKQCLEKLSEEVTFKLRCDRGQDSSECRVSREERIVWRSLGEGIHKSCESTGHEDFRILLKFLPGATGCLAA